MLNSVTLENLVIFKDSYLLFFSPFIGLFSNHQLLAYLKGTLGNMRCDQIWKYARDNLHKSIFCRASQFL